MPKHKSKSKKQKLYRMKGCSKRHTRRKRYLGGSSNVITTPNANLAYTPIARAYPTQPSSGGFNFLTPQAGGKAGEQQQAAAVAEILGGGAPHRSGCRCSKCKTGTLQMGGGCGSCSNTSGGPMPMESSMKMFGGSGMSNNGIPYPNGLLGNAWTPDVKGWPGLDGVSMSRNHLGYNTYSTDVSRQMAAEGANPPFSSLKGGRRGKKGTQKQKKRQRGGTLTNHLGQDLINLGSQFKFNAGSSWNAIRGNAQTANPLPWKDQMSRVPVPPP